MRMIDSYPMPRERNAILISLGVLTAGAWAFLLWQSGTVDDQAMGLTMAMGVSLFLANWVAMMVAIMFPTAAPMILAFAKVYASKRHQGQAFVPTWVFTVSYLAVWTVFGVLAFAGAVVAEQLMEQSSWLTDNAARFGGGILILAGLYQLSPLKNSCLAKCRTPLSFILSSWRDGYSGAIRMGLEHGVYCMGCCWLLFVILFPLGIMNVAVMAVITLLIFAEKSTPIGRQMAQLAAAVLIAYGLLVVFVPDMLPTMMKA